MSLKIFISCAHQDRALYEEFSKHLQVLKREDLISSWADSDIAPGAEKMPQIGVIVRKM